MSNSNDIKTNFKLDKLLKFGLQIVIGLVPVLIILFGFQAQRTERFAIIEKEIISIDNRLTKIEVELDLVEDDITSIKVSNQKLAVIESRLTRIDKDLDKIEINTQRIISNSRQKCSN